MGKTRPRSVRRELLVLLLTAVAAAWIIAAAASFLDARHEVAEVLDAHLAQTAALVIGEWNGGGSDFAQAIGTEHVPVLHRYGRRVMFQVWQNGQLRLHSQSAPGTRLSPLTDGFDDVVVAGARWRVFSAWSPQRTFFVQVAEQSRERDELAAAIGRNFVVPLMVTLPILGLLVWGAVGRATRSLTRVNEAVESRDPDNLAPLDPSDAPSEIRALVANLNALFGRVHSMIEQERRFTADAAHELRTPLAGIRAQAQVARGAADNVERSRALDGVIAGCDRATHAVEQMLTLARLAPEAVSFERTSVDLVRVLSRAIAALTPMALEKRIDIALTTLPNEPVFASGDAGLLGVLFRNLIDNAQRYSPAGTPVDVIVDATGTKVCVRVEDRGPGIPEKQRANIGRRFYRQPGTDAAGTGLGLSIAQRIVELHDGLMQFDTLPGGTGLRVTVVLTRARVAA